jgi:four helix bundle protein
MNDGLENLIFYKEAQALYDLCWGDTDLIREDERGKVIAAQLIKSMGSVSANIEEGYGRGFGKEYPRFLKIARGSARESRGWYNRSKFLLSKEIIDARISKLNFILACITKTIQTIEQKRKGDLGK